MKYVITPKIALEQGEFEKRKNILIVDDNDSPWKTLRFICDKKGFETEIAQTGREAIEKLKEQFFNIVLLNNKLPDIEGIELLKSFKELHPNIEIVMVIAYTNVERAVRALNEGASALITKPLKTDEFFAILSKIFEKQRLIAEKRQADKMLKQTYIELDQIFNISNPLCFIDKNFNVIRVNDTFLSLFQLEKADILGKKCYEVISGQLCDTPQCSLKQIMAGKNYWDYEKNIKLRNDTPITCIMRAVPYRGTNGEIIGIIQNYADITARKIAEIKLKESEEKYREAYNQVRFYQDILAHDMTNILQNLLSSVELLSLYQTNSTNTENIKEVLHILNDQANRAVKLIFNVNKLSHLENNSISLEKIEAYPILKSAINNLNRIYLNKEITIHLDSCDKKLYVKTNELLLDVFENILINAVKFNYNPVIEIAIKVSKKQINNLYYTIFEFIDNGFGIPDDMKEKIFFGSYRTEKKIKGMGFGLSLVKKIIKSYNGTIQVEDKVKGDYSKGSNFIISIPALY